MNKKNLIIVVMMVVATLLIWIFFGRSNKPSTTNVYPAPITLSPIDASFLPTTPNSGQEQYINIPSLSFQATLPVYIFEKSNFIEKNINTIVSAFNFNGPLTTIEGAKTTYHSGNSGIQSIIISDRPPTFTYDIATLSGKIVSSEMPWYESFVSSLVYGKNIIPPLFKLETPTVSYLSPIDSAPREATPQTATVIQLDFELSVNGFPIFVNSAAVAPLTARFDGNRSLLQLRGYLFPPVNTTVSVVKLISYEEAVNRLISNKGILTNTTIASKEDLSFEQAPKQIEISKVRLGYLYDYLAQQLSPVFVFLGSGPLDDKRVVFTTTVVSAIP